MKTFIYAFVKETEKAVPFYQKAFNAEIVKDENFTQDEDGTYWHVELKFGDNLFGLSELSEDNPDVIGNEKIIGNIMQFGLIFESNEEAKLRNAYEVLKEGADIFTPLEEVEYADLICDLVDKYGIRWCLAIKKSK